MRGCGGRAGDLDASAGTARHGTGRVGVRETHSATWLVRPWVAPSTRLRVAPDPERYEDRPEGRLFAVSDQPRLRCSARDGRALRNTSEPITPRREAMTTASSWLCAPSLARMLFW